MECELIKQGFEQGSCQVFDFEEEDGEKLVNPRLSIKMEFHTG